MSARLREMAKATEQIVAAGGWTTPDGRRTDIAQAVARARRGTRLYGPEPVAVPAWEPVAGTTEFEVTAEGSLEAARRLAATAPVAVLNFASARNPGGGYLNGAQAQEEALCRGSALYTCLREAPDFYAAHRADASPFYSDRVIHSPAVPVFRDDRGTLLDTPFEAGFLTCPAPNAGVIAQRMPGVSARVPGALVTRAERVLEVAAAHHYRQLVLGAWGCGVFRNEPADVATAFATHLTGGGRFADCFERVVFAVLDRRTDSPVREAFARRFPRAES
ncbi:MULTISPECIES: TIGR02452 family protein [Streptomyces]|uniref:TIGR02452 family protein n=1 Tax=Streptomyces morookaense TaxID=1970 RepID=A0A7Y7E6L2_STRMO|nr:MULTISPECIES: TIGR02452 family protein [Streptomyces]MCC2278038.1 TIGR02452 family protein [Streptomyces sp. ET3-23]NVK77414.1 TIGR02452 family protein [Streptomyces morookaense]